MLKKISIVCLGLVSLFIGHAQADGKYYGGNVSFLEYSETGAESASLTALIGRVGTHFNENFSGEIRLGFGFGNDTVDVLGLDAKVELDNMFGAYIRGGVPLSDSFFPYVVAGFSRGQVSAVIPGFGGDTESESDFSFGMGIDFNLTKNSTINIEFINYLDKDGADIDGFSIGFASQF